MDYQPTKPSPRSPAQITRVSYTMANALSFKTDMQFTYGEPRALASGVRRIVANNGGPLTFKGTNTYLVGTKTLAVIDPGPDDPSHRAAILEAARNAPITHILITHRHRDHVDGVAALQDATGAKTYAFDGTRRFTTSASNTPSGQEFIDTRLVPDVEIQDGDLIKGEDWTLTALYTPGHAPDHVCFALETEGVLFSGDHIMSWNTSVIAPPEGNMADYIASLEKIVQRQDTALLPGHGGQLKHPARIARAYLHHRKWREQTILRAIQNGASTINNLVSEIYSAVPDGVAGAAALSVLAHVELLHARGLVTCVPKPQMDAEILPA